jgi:hypothetical protein
MQINLIPDNSVSSAPAGFTAAVQEAADIFEEDLSGNYTLNIRYGWGTFNNQADASLTNPNSGDFSIGGTVGSTVVTYTTLKKWLSADATLSDQEAAVASLPANDSSFPGDANLFVVSSAQEKALGVYDGSNTAIDGAIGFNVGDTSDSSQWLGAALTEIAHALGWSTEYYASDPTVADLFRFSAPGKYEWIGGEPAYFSINDGQTDLANFSTTFDYTLFTSLPANDPLHLGLTSSTDNLTSFDIEALNVIGFGSSSMVCVAQYRSAPLASYVSMPTADTTRYRFYDAGGTGDGDLTVNGVAEPNGKWVRVSAARLDSVQFYGGDAVGQQTLYTESFDSSTETWSGPSSFIGMTEDPPVTVNVNSVRLAENTSIVVRKLVASVTNEAAYTLTEYGFYDAGGSTNGYFTVNGAAQPVGQWIDVNINDLRSVHYVAGSSPGRQKLEVEVFNATANEWSAESMFTARTTKNGPSSVDDGNSANLALLSQYSASSLAAPSGTSGSLTIADPASARESHLASPHG